MESQHLSALKDKRGLWKNGHVVSNTGRTWWKKGRIPWNKGIKRHGEIKLTGKTILCIVCGKEKYFEPNQIKKRPCKFCSVICARKYGKKTDLVYSSIHSRIRSEWGRATKCFSCGSEKNVDWANISKTYLLQRSDWLQLCRKHHVAYDRGKLEIIFPI
ncbi:MAG: hypothetical protein AAB907_04440 [Patescibacteria group bacterium]